MSVAEPQGDLGRAWLDRSGLDRDGDGIARE
jgi:hypothetical protein